MSELLRSSRMIPAAAVGLVILAGCGSTSEAQPNQQASPVVAEATTHPTTEVPTTETPPTMNTLAIDAETYRFIGRNTCTVTAIREGRPGERRLGIDFRVDRPADAAAKEDEQIAQGNLEVTEEVETYTPVGKQPRMGQPITMRKISSYYADLATGSMIIDRTKPERPAFDAYLADNKPQKGTQVILFHTVNSTKIATDEQGGDTYPTLQVRKACEGTATYDGKEWKLGKTPKPYLQPQVESIDTGTPECTMTAAEIIKLKSEVAAGKAPDLGDCEPVTMIPKSR